MCDDGFDDRILILLCANSYILYQLTPKYHMSYLKIHVIYTWASLKKKKIKSNELGLFFGNQHILMGSLL